MLSSPPPWNRKAKHAEYPDSPCGTEVSITDNTWENSSREGVGVARPPSNFDGDFEDFLLNEDLGLEFDGLYYFWRFCVGATGLLDILACILPSLVRSYNHIPKTHSDDTFHVAIDGLSTYLDRHDTTIGFLFSAVWFMDTFLAAHAKFKIIVLDGERSQCLGNGGEAEQRTNWWQTPSFVYYRSTIIQLLLLPVGFYLFAFFVVDDLFHSIVLEDLGKVHKTVVETAKHRFSTDSKGSVLFVVLQHIVLKISGLTTQALRSKLRQIVRKLRPAAIKTLVSTVFRNPRRFRRTLKKILTVVRWMKYLAPLVGAINKLKGNVDDMRNKRRQKRIADKQRRVQQLLWTTTPLQIREAQAATIIQRAHRAHMRRKALTVKGLQSSWGDTKHVAAITIQVALRSYLFRARLRLRKKASEFQRLCDIQQEQKEGLDRQAKKRLFELQDELCAEANRLINKRLLLRPNTRFAVAWKVLFVVSVVLEVTQLALKPWFESHKNHGAVQRMSMPDFIALSFVPTRASQRKECGYIPERKGVSSLDFFWTRKRKNQLDAASMPWYCTQPGSSIQEAYSDVLSLLLVPAPASEWPDCRETKHKWRESAKGDSKRWYCHEPYSYLHHIYRRVFDYLLDQFIIIISFVCFLDVFVTFFTGEIHALTGELIPKPFFARWLIPGLALQLLLNPQLATLADCVATFWNAVLDFGPVRVLRWSVTTIVPIVVFLWQKFTRYVWMPLVKYENNVDALVDDIII